MTSQVKGLLEPIHALNMGVGVQTTACLIKYNKKYKYCVFADPGDEDKKTYWYIENYLKPFCKENGIEWVTVSHKMTLYDWCMKRKILPIRTRRWCTKDWKIKPLNKFYKSLGATRKNPIYADLGISWDEAHRANYSDEDVKYVVKCFPLVDVQITRNECEKIILDYGWPIPPKSGCVFCPFWKRKKMVKLLAEDKETFDRMVLLEKNEYTYPKHPLIGNFTLESLTKNKSLDEFEEDDGIDSCQSGHCFV